MSSTSAPIERVAPSSRRRVLLLGATGTIGRATARELTERGHDVVCVVRDAGAGAAAAALDGATLRRGDATDPASLRDDGFRGERFDAVISCLASRSGAPADAWAVDSAANRAALDAARDAGVSRFVLLSAICVQKPRLAFQQAKLDFERALVQSGMNYSIVRPTAFFKSLSGQIDRLRRGKPFLVFGDGRSTACKPIGDRDCAAYLASSLEDETFANQILPIGGPGPAITPIEQGEALFRLLDRTPRFQRVPVALFDVAARTLDALGAVFPRLKDKAEFARIARYYATESMLLWDAERERYDADATPSFGTETLFDHYAALVRGGAVERVDGKLF